MRFSHLCSSVIPYSIETKFATELLTRQGRLHSKFEEICSSHFRDTSSQSLGFFLLFAHFAKIRHITQMRAPIGLKFGTLKGII